jgi:hypothetical protein
MHRRGVRRIFAIFLKKKPRVCEWSAETKSWVTLAPDTAIEDPCLVTPLEVGALLDAAAADKAVAEALIAKGEPTLRKLEARGKARGKAEGRIEGRVEATTEAIVKILEARGLPVSAVQREAILACRDFKRLDRWLRRVAEVSSVEELTNAR